MIIEMRSIMQLLNGEGWKVLINPDSSLGEKSLEELIEVLNSELKTWSVSGEPNTGKSWLISLLAGCHVP